MIRYLILLSLFFILGCSSKLINDNQSASAYESNYPTAEIYFQDKLYHGLGISSIPLGTDLSKVNLSIQGYYEGRISVTSTSCKIDYATDYKKSELVRIPLRGIARDCIFAITVRPLYPKQKYGDVVVYPFIGYFAIKALDQNIEWVGLARKSDLTNLNWKLDTGDTRTMLLKLNTNTETFEKSLDPVGGIVNVPLGLAIKKRGENYYLSGLLISQEYSDIRLSSLVSTFKSGYKILRVPTLKVEKGKLHVTPETIVTIIALDNKYVIGNKASFDFDSSKKHTLRIITSKGRSVIGQYNKGVWTWMQ